MKQAMTAVVWTAMMFGAIGCGDEETSDVVTMTVAQCEHWYDKVSGCGISDISDGYGLTTDIGKQLCGVGVALSNCEYREFSSTCKKMYSRYTECFYGLETCEDIESMYDAMNAYDSEIASDMPCIEAYQDFSDTCLNEMNDAVFYDACADEYEAYLDMMMSLFPYDYDTDYETDGFQDSDSAVDESTDTEQ